MKSFWNYHKWEALLCLLAAAAMVLNFSQGFYIPDAVADNVPIALAVCAAALLYCYLGSYNRLTIFCFSLGFVVIAAAFFLWMRSAGIDIVDQEGSATAVYIYVIAAPLIAGIVFLLSRSRLGIGVLFLAGTCLHAVLFFLDFEVKLWCAVLFVLAVIPLFLLRQYRVSALRSSTVNPKFAQYFFLSAAVGAMGVLLAAACWAVVIRPLQPPILDLELLTKYMSYEVLDMLGIADQYPIPDDLLSKQDSEQALQAGQEGEQGEDSPPVERNELESDIGQETPETGASELNVQELDSVTYNWNVTSLLAALIILVILLIASIPFLRRYARRRRMARLTQGEPREQVIGLYRFYMKKFARIGFPREPAQTELEYASQHGEHLAPYARGGLSVEQMTAIYLDARYGGLPVSEEDRAAFAAFYGVFLNNYRDLSGRVRYLTKYFVL